MDMDLAPLDWPWWMTHAGPSAMVLARIAGVCLTVPVFTAPGLDWRFRAVLTMVLGALLVPVVEPLVGPIPGGIAAAWAVLGELLVGSLLGGSSALIVAAARQAGDIVAAQSGLSASALFDPETGDELTPLGHLYGLIAMAVFLAMEGPLRIVEVVVESYRLVPAGSLAADRGLATEVFAQVGRALGLALRAAAPAAVALAIAGIVLGWLGRLAPAVPLTTLSLPIRVFLGITLITLGLASLSMTFSEAWMSWPWGR